MPRAQLAASAGEADADESVLALLLATFKLVKYRLETGAEEAR
jgi:hypothetical protein